MEKILLLGGTKEAVELARELVSKGHTVITSLAGRTKEPEPVAGDLRIGGFGGSGGLAEYIRQNAIDRVIDCTHPFARQISANAVEATRLTSIKLERRTRPEWQKQTGDNWQSVESLEAASLAIPAGARVLLALGRQYLESFSKRNDVFFIVRMVDQPEKEPDLAQYELILGKPSSDWKEEETLLQNKQITHIVCRNSGGSGAYAKIEAARHLGLPVIMIER
ncbi:MAG: cobalt-precorrin-6A reductase [Pseudomonadota bacterium]